MPVIQFRARQLREENREVHRQISATGSQGEVASLTVRRQNAWAEFQLATRQMVEWQNRMQEAHMKWLDLDIQVFAANAAEKL